MVTNYMLTDEDSFILILFYERSIGRMTKTLEEKMTFNLATFLTELRK